jgi:hypothetical protein
MILSSWAHCARMQAWLLVATMYRDGSFGGQDYMLSALPKLLRPIAMRLLEGLIEDYNRCTQ